MIQPLHSRFRPPGFLAMVLIAVASVAHGEPLWQFETGG
jgi:hypothetical protein